MSSLSLFSNYRFIIFFSLLCFFVSTQYLLRHTPDSVESFRPNIVPASSPLKEERAELVQPSPVVVYDDKVQFFAVVDAGSTGSRVFIYTQRENYDFQEVSRLKVTPGISSFANGTEINPDLFSSLASLFDHALDIIPENYHSLTHVHVKATAGVRLLDRDSQLLLLSSVKQFIEEKYPFSLRSVDVIEGQMEAMFAWIATNYVKGFFSSKMQFSDLENTVAIADLGGASTQIAFFAQPPTENHTLSFMDMVVPSSGRSSPSPSADFHLFSHSFLGYGERQFMRKIILRQLEKQLTQTSPLPCPLVVRNPCLPGGFPSASLPLTSLLPPHLISPTSTACVCTKSITNHTKSATEPQPPHQKEAETVAEESARPSSPTSSSASPSSAKSRPHPDKPGETSDIRKVLLQTDEDNNADNSQNKQQSPSLAQEEKYKEEKSVFEENMAEAESGSEDDAVVQTNNENNTGEEEEKEEKEDDIAPLPPSSPVPTSEESTHSSPPPPVCVGNVENTGQFDECVAVIEELIAERLGSCDSGNEAVPPHTASTRAPPRALQGKREEEGEEMGEEEGGEVGEEGGAMKSQCFEGVAVPALGNRPILVFDGFSATIEFLNTRSLQQLQERVSTLCGSELFTDWGSMLAEFPTADSNWREHGLAWACLRGHYMLTLFRDVYGLSLALPLLQEQSHGLARRHISWTLGVAVHEALFLQESA
eukprot:GCRY01000716.1.p1 GENE.GCRY01000716.1~~GCRY01000716.1.p1  ORF type:complete len:708 (+),score=184.09 GCRY01000716.1:207-2330(+)